MRGTSSTLALMLVLASALPSQAQWWGPGGARPCFGFCRPWMGRGGWARPARFGVVGFMPRPRPFWAGPGGFGPPRFGPAGFGWWRRPMWWRREVQWRRFNAWRRWAALSGRRPETLEERPNPVHRWNGRTSAATSAFADAGRESVRSTPTITHSAQQFRPAWHARAVPAGAEEAVAIMPAAAIHAAPSAPHHAIASHVLATAAMLRRFSAAPPLPPSLPVVHAAFRPSALLHPSQEHRSILTPARMPVAPHLSAPPPRSTISPVTLRSDPAPAAPLASPPAEAPALPAAPKPATDGDVPVAPLD